MGREQRDPKHLLDTDADQNIGNSAILLPQPGSGGVVIPQTNPARLLMLSGPSRAGQTTTVVFTASRIVGPDNPNPGYAGPITGVVEFGNGGRSTRVEVDIPIGPYTGLFQGAQQATEPQDGGVMVTLPTGVLRAYARYDNLLCAANLGLPTLSTAQKLGVPFIGPGGPRNYPGPPPSTTPPEPVLVKAMAAYFARHYSKAYKTQYCYVGDLGVPAQNLTSGANTAVLVCVPPFARSVRVLRDPSDAPIRMFMYDGINYLDACLIPSYTAAGAPNPQPAIPLVGNETVLMVQTTGVPVTFLALCYEIGI